jgi:hypothetical protein
MMVSRKFGLQKSIVGYGHARARGTSVEELFRAASRTAEQLHECLRDGSDARDCFATLIKILAALPLSQSEYALLYCRLVNADRYDLVGEQQVAAYEIGLLAKRLRAELARVDA